MRLDPAPELVARFAAELDRLVPAGAKIGVAVSGGPDSLALLLLAAAARPGAIQAATVDHALRPQSAAEATQVARLCEQLGLQHSTLVAQWDRPPETAIQERARDERYRLLAGWSGEQQLAAVATAHHADDQAETFLMRLGRGAGVRGLAAMRAAGPLPGSTERLIRPLLGWRRAQLGEICRAAGLEPVRDPANDDQRFERVRMRQALAGADWLDPEAIAHSAANLAGADVALEWAAAHEWQRAVTRDGDQLAYSQGRVPDEIRRRVVQRAVATVATEGGGAALRGRELDQLLELLHSGGTATLRGARCSGGEQWTFAPAPPRRQA